MDDTTKTAPPDEAAPAAKPCYGAWLPSPVRYDTRLTASAKLLYAEISALTDSTGYCWATNDYFERLYGISTRSVIRMIDSLAKAGYIRIVNPQTTRRRIYAGLNPLGQISEEDASDKIVTRSTKKRTSAKNVTATDNFVTASAKNVTAIYNEGIDQENGSSPQSPPRGQRVNRRENQTTAPAWKPERFKAFWLYYPAIPDGNGHGRRPAKARAAKAWDKLRPDDRTLAAMGAALKRQKESRQWAEGIGIPYAATWLNSRAWEEEVEDVPNVQSAQAAQEETVEWV